MDSIYFYGLILFFLLYISFYVVNQQTAAVIERFGRFLLVSQSGLRIRIPFIDRIVGKISLKIQQLDVMIETKTKDNVFVKLKVSVQFQVVKKRWKIHLNSVKIYCNNICSDD